MSADNGVYILKSRTPMVPQNDTSWVQPENEYEYRVAHCQAIDNIDYSDLYLVVYFIRSKVYLTYEEALARAQEIYDGIMDDDFCPIVEYGISTIAGEREMPNMTFEQAQDALGRPLKESWGDRFIKGLYVLKQCPEMEVMSSSKQITVSVSLDSIDDTRSLEEAGWSHVEAGKNVLWVLEK